MAGPSPVVDIHAHFAPQRAIDAADRGDAWHGITFSRGADGKFVSQVGASRAPLAWEVPFETAGQRLASLDARSIDIQMVSLTPTMYWHDLDAGNGRGLARDVNDELAEFVERGAGRYIGLGFLPLQDPKGAVAELERAMRDLGFAGAVVASHVHGTDWDSAELFPVLEAAAALGAFVLIHPAKVRASPFLGKYYLRNFLGNPMETTIAAAAMIFGGVLDRLPDLKVGLSHAGGYAALAIGRMDHGHQVRPETRNASKLPSELLKAFWIDSIAHSPLALRHVIDEIGIGRVLLGSDYPADMGEPYPVDFVNSCASLTAHEKTRILSGNIGQLIGERHFEAWRAAGR